jgi:hypothetical protein
MWISRKYAQSVLEYFFKHNLCSLNGENEKCTENFGGESILDNDHLEGQVGCGR